MHPANNNNIIIIIMITIIIEGLSLLQSIPPTMANNMSRGFSYTSSAGRRAD